MDIIDKLEAALWYDKDGAISSAINEIQRLTGANNKILDQLLMIDTACQAISGALDDFLMAMSINQVDDVRKSIERLGAGCGIDMLDDLSSELADVVVNYDAGLTGLSFRESARTLINAKTDLHREITKLKLMISKSQQ